MGKKTKIARKAQEQGLSEKEYLVRLIRQYGNQKEIANALGVTQSAVSQAFIRHGIRPVVSYVFEDVVA
jgi:DNA-directed RNA polymerase specialized sigma subunit